ncbi:MAG: hypothetical protein WC602_05835 [archaeon]
MAGTGNEFVFFLEQHPEAFKAANSERHIEMLSLISRLACNPESASKETGFTAIESKMILLELKEAGLAGTIKAGMKTHYYASKLGVELLKKYESAKRSFGR